MSVELTAFDNFWEKNGVGNYWVNYHGSDANWDGIGDSPYIIDANNVDRYPLLNPLGTHEPQVGLGFSQTVLIIAAIAGLILVAAGLLVYHKRKHRN